jgi:hypothetical protein
LQDNEIFQEFSGRKLDLATKLEIPHSMKTIWIFSNGRSDIKPPKPHERGLKWTNVYSAGIRDAVIFFSQKEITPKGRALVILLLFLLSSWSLHSEINLLRVLSVDMTAICSHSNRTVISRNVSIKPICRNSD